MAFNEGNLLVPSGKKWYAIVNQVPEPVSTTLPRDQEVSLRKEAEQLLQHESDLYSSNLDEGSKKSDFGFMRSVLKTGTLRDKLAAHTLLLQNSALHNLSSIKTMMEIVKSKGKREYLLAADHLKELFLGDLLPPERKLRPFGEIVRQMDEALKKEGKERNVFLMVAFFEDQLKYCYKEFIEVIERNSHDPIGVTKSKSVNLMYELLANNSEQEQYLLEHLTNKLGDPVPKIASHSCQLLRKLITEDHPAMKEVVVKEVERLLFRPNIKERAQYYCLCFLQEVVFVAKRDEKLANRLIDIYLGFFKKSIEEGEVNNKTMTVLLTGVSRSLPFSSASVVSSILEQHLETFYRIIYLVNTNIGIQVLSLIFQVLTMISSKETIIMTTNKPEKKRRKLSRDKKKKKDSDTKDSMEDTVDSRCESSRLRDRFYSALFRFLLKKDVFESTSRPGMLFNVIFRSLKSDDKTTRVCSFIKRLLQVRK